MTRTIHPCLTWILALVVLSYPATSYGQPVTLEAVRKAWAARQEKCKTARVVWSNQAVIPKGSNNSVAVAMNPEDHGIYPPVDSTVTATSELLLDEERYWIRRSGHSWSAQLKQFMKTTDEHYLSKQRQVNYNISKESSSHGTANIHKTDYSLTLLQTSSNFPVFCATRGAFGKAPFGDILSEYDLTSRSAVISGRTCVELVRGSRTQETTDSLWIDPGREMSLVRRVKMHKSTVTHQLDVSSEERPGLGWFPKSWKSVSMRSDGSLSESVSCTVTTCEVGVATSPTDFEPVFAPGTQVIDHTGNQVTTFVIQPDGNEGGHIPRQQLPTYEQLASTRANPFTNASSVWLYVIASLIALVVLVSAVWAWNRFLRRQRATPQQNGNP